MTNEEIKKTFIEELEAQKRFIETNKINCTDLYDKEMKTYDDDLKIINFKIAAIKKS